MGLKTLLVPRAHKEITMEIYELAVVRAVSCVLTCTVAQTFNDGRETNSL
jgi:hypothetical protein